MSDFLARYESGEHEQVWEELVALGEQVRAEPLSDEALAVAHETMRRTRHNIELLIPRLVAVGYQFGYGWIQPFIRERLIRPYSANYDPATGKFAQGVVVEPSIPNAFSVKQRLAYEEYLDLARDQPPLFTPATDAAERIAYLEGEIADDQERIAQLKRDVAGFSAGPGGREKHLRQMQAELRSKPSAQDLVNDLESLLGTVPLSVRTWYEVVGGVNFVGDHAGWRELLPQSVPTSEFDYLNPMHWLDPLFMYPLDEARLAHYRRWLKPGQVTHRLTLAEDETGKYLDSPRRYGEIILPSATMDAPFTYGGQLFVAYLRNCFRWGGFPGWARFEKRPEEDLAFVTRDLLPI